MKFDFNFVFKILFVILPMVSFNSVFGGDNRFSTPLTGTEEVPPVDVNSTGIALFELLNNNSITFKVNVTNMDNIKAAHVHLGVFGQNGDVVATIFNSSTPQDILNGTLVEGKLTETDLQGPLKGNSTYELVNLMNATKTYVNIHTIEHPNGEIRGQITTVNATNWWDN